MINDKFVWHPGDIVFDDSELDELVDELFKEWANNNVKGKKGFQPKTETPSEGSAFPLSSSAVGTALTANERKSLEDWVIRDGERMAIYLRSGREPALSDGGRLEEASKHMDSAIQKSVVVEPTVVYRGVEGPGAERYQVGAVVRDKSYVSTTRDIEIAADFAGWGSGPIIRVTLQPGQRAIYVSPFVPRKYHGQAADFADEHEVLLPRGTALRVTRRSVDQDGATWLDAEVVP